MSALSPAVEDLLNAALVAELTVVDPSGRPVSYPLIPLYDGTHIYMTSSVLFSKKLEHIKANPRVALSISDPNATPVDQFQRVTIQGDARVLEEDLHDDWERLLPLWTKKEPVIAELVKKRFAMPLFWERAVIEITPLRVVVWPAGGDGSPDVHEVRVA